MKRLGTLVLALLLLVAGAPPASAAERGGVDYRYRDNVVFASAYFSSYDDATCTRTNVYVFAVLRVGPPPDATEIDRVAEVNTYQADCLGNSSWAYGDTAGSQVHRLECSRDLSKGELHATIALRAEGDSEPSLSAEVNLAWTGTGTFERTTTHAVIASAERTVNERHFNSFRWATASGTVVVDGINRAPLPSQSAYLATERTSYLVVSP